MAQQVPNQNRRNFLKTIGAAGLGSAIATTRIFAQSKDPNKIDPNTQDVNDIDKKETSPFEMRKFGNKDFKIPCFTLGVMFPALENLGILRKALELKVYSWDCAYVYTNGNSEVAIGKILEENPGLRKKMFITSKSGGTPDVLEAHLQESLKRMNTDYIDLYHGVHGLNNPEDLNDDLRKWAESAKKRKLIRYLGFSTHSNMADCLLAAAKLGWIDAAISSYSYRLMNDDKMNKALDACQKAGVAVIAMKTQAGRQRRTPETDKEKELIEYFTKKGFTPGQAKIKVVLQDKRICSACVGLGRGNMEHLILGVDAVQDKRSLDKKDVAFLTDYANRTCDGYCAGCANICGAAAPSMPYIADVMRYLMYYNSYEDHQMARENFAQLPAWAKANLLSTDYSLAEARCPNRLPITDLVKEAASKLA